MKEIWKDVPGYEGIYKVSNLGKLKSVKRLVNNGYGFREISEKILKPKIQYNGYHRYVLCKNDKKKYFYIHRLVALCFIENNNNKPQINHIDGNKNNNSFNNLEWVTNKENMDHAINNNLVSSVGESNPMCKFKKEDIIKIRSINNITNVEIAKIYKTSANYISDIKYKRVWKHV